MAAFRSSRQSGEGDDDAAAQMAQMFGPSHIDHSIRQAVQFCWMTLPRDRKSYDELEVQIRRLVDRALRDFREDREQFGASGE